MTSLRPRFDEVTPACSLLLTIPLTLILPALASFWSSLPGTITYRTLPPFVLVPASRAIPLLPN